MHIPVALAPRLTSHQAAVESLRRSILGGNVPGGTRLVQSDIAAQLGVSTTPVREAFRDLAAEGLLRLDAYRGAIVCEPSREDADEIYRLRLLLEPAAVRLAAPRITDAELAEVEQLARLAEETTDPGEWVLRNRAFHGALTASAGSSRLSAILNNLRDAAAIHVGASLQAREGQMAQGNRDHRAIVDAYRRGDVDEAVRITEVHLQSTLNAINE